jgi:hypothetical protein
VGTVSLENVDHRDYRVYRDHQVKLESKVAWVHQESQEKDDKDRVVVVIVW